MWISGPVLLIGTGGPFCQAFSVTQEHSDLKQRLCRFEYGLMVVLGFGVRFPIEPNQAGKPTRAFLDFFETAILLLFGAPRSVWVQFVFCEAMHLRGRTHMPTQMTSKESPVNCVSSYS